MGVPFQIIDHTPDSHENHPKDIFLLKCYIHDEKVALWNPSKSPERIFDSHEFHMISCSDKGMCGVRGSGSALGPMDPFLADILVFSFLYLFEGIDD